LLVVVQEEHLMVIQEVTLLEAVEQEDLEKLNLQSHLIQLVL
jgi:hypothetical protein